MSVAKGRRIQLKLVKYSFNLLE